jgi:hypothetical protein
VRGAGGGENLVHADALTCPCECNGVRERARERGGQEGVGLRGRGDLSLR